MRLLARPDVLVRAGLAALLTCLSCYPRLAGWGERIHSVALLFIALLYVAFVLWAFVFAWQFRYASRPVFVRFQLKLWAGATACVLAWCLLCHWLLDPTLRLVTPRDYPADFQSWLAMSLFTLGFDPLFLCFAPFAFFVRLSQKQTVSLVLTVLFGTFILAVKLGSSTVLPPFLLIVGLMSLRVAQGFFSVYLYLRGGAVLVWWLVVLMQLRHLIGLVPGR